MLAWTGSAWVCSNEVSTDLNTAETFATTAANNATSTAETFATNAANAAQANAESFAMTAATTAATAAQNTAEAYANSTFLPLSGGTLTGSLAGTSANFSGNLQAAAGTFTGGLSATGLFTASGGAALPSIGNSQTAGSPSNPLDLIASASNGATASNQTFRWQAVNADGATPSASLNLLFGSGTNMPTATGLSIAPNTITLDPTFAQTVNTRIEYHVFLTPNGDCEGLYVAQKSPTGFEVHELHAGKSSVAFDYRIVAKRRGLESLRLEVVSTDHDRAERMRGRLAARPSHTPMLMDSPKRPEPAAHLAPPKPELPILEPPKLRPPKLPQQPLAPEPPQVKPPVPPQHAAVLEMPK